MFENLSDVALQQYWWVIISILGSSLVFLMFVQGGQTLIYTLGKNEEERTLIVNSLGRKWEFTFTTLVTFGGAFFASFPLFYSTSFGGAYWVWMTILFAFVIQAVSYEYRSKPNNFFGHKTFETFLFINGAVGTILIGTAVATFFSGSDFIVDELNRSRWGNNAHGLEAALNPFNLCLGFAVFFLSRVMAILYFINNIDNPNIYKKSKKSLLLNSILFLLFFLVFLIWLMLRNGFAVNPSTMEIYIDSNKYFKNLVDMPIVMILLISGIVLVITGILKSMFTSSTKGIFLSGGGAFLTVLSLFFLAGLNNTAFYPSFPFESSIRDNPELLKKFIQSSLTIHNSSSSHYTLSAMSYVSLAVPFVIAYIAYTWNAINKKKISLEELNVEEHKY